MFIIFWKNALDNEGNHNEIPGCTILSAIPQGDGEEGAQTASVYGQNDRGGGGAEVAFSTKNLRTV